MGMFGIKKNKRKQDSLLLTEDGRILELKLAVVKGYVVEHKTAEAWGLFPDSRIPERGTNRLFSVITERDAAPVSLDGKDNSKRLKEQISKIAQENASAARAKIQKKSQKNKYTETLQLLMLILGITVGVLVIFGLFASGKLHWPGGGGGGSIF